MYDPATICVTYAPMLTDLHMRARCVGLYSVHYERKNSLSKVVIRDDVDVVAATAPSKTSALQNVLFTADMDMDT